MIPPAHVLAAEMQASFAEHFRQILTEEALRKARIEERVQEALRAQPPQDVDRHRLDLAGWLAEHDDQLWRAYVDRVARETAVRHQKRDPEG